MTRCPLTALCNLRVRGLIGQTPYTDAKLIAKLFINRAWQMRPNSPHVRLNLMFVTLSQQAAKACHFAIRHYRGADS